MAPPLEQKEGEDGCREADVAEEGSCEDGGVCRAKAELESPFGVMARSPSGDGRGRLRWNRRGNP